MDPHITQKQNNSLACPIQWLNGSEELEKAPKLWLSLNLDKFNPYHSTEDIKAIKDCIDLTVPVYKGNDYKGRKYVVFQMLVAEKNRIKPEYLKTIIVPFIMYKNTCGNLCVYDLGNSRENMNHLARGELKNTVKTDCFKIVKLWEVFQGKEVSTCHTYKSYDYRLTSKEIYEGYLEIMENQPKKDIPVAPETLRKEEIAEKWSDIQELEEKILALDYHKHSRWYEELGAVTPFDKMSTDEQLEEIKHLTVVQAERQLISLEMKRNKQLRLLCTEENLKNLMFHLLGVGENPRGIDEHTSLYTGRDKDKNFYFRIQYIFPDQKEPKNIFRDTITIEYKGSSLYFTYEKSPSPLGGISACKLLSKDFIRLRHIQMIQRLVQKGVSTPEDYDRITKACKKELL